MSYILYTDGSIVPKNPGGHGVGGWILYEQNTLISKGVVDLGYGSTNNLAEYAGLFGGLYWICKNLHKAEVEIRSDSQLIIKQMREEWKCKDPKLKEFWNSCKHLAAYFFCTYTWIPRDLNKEADEISRSLYGICKSTLPEEINLIEL